MRKSSTLRIALMAVLASVFTFNLIAAEVQMSSSNILWQPETDYSKAVLVVSGPNGLVFEQTFDSADSPYLGLFDKAGSPLVDGSYTYELRFHPVVSDATREAMVNAREQGAAAEKSSPCSCRKARR